MKRNKYICVLSSVNENPASNFNEFAETIGKGDTFESAWADFKWQLVNARTKK